MINYLQAMKIILNEGELRENRTDTRAYSVFGRINLSFNLEDGFPICTTKKVFFKSIVKELLWFISGDTNARTLQKQNVKIWDAWADPETGDLGPIYGKQWRRAGVLGDKDQLQKAVETLLYNPMDRGIIVNAWQVDDLEDMALRPCHTMFQFWVSQDQKLSCSMYQRSADWFIGVPFNIAQYALLTHIIANVCGLRPGALHIRYGDAHIYENHMDQCLTQLSRAPYPLPEVMIRRPLFSLDNNLCVEDFELVGYNHHPYIKAPVAV